MLDSKKEVNCLLILKQEGEDASTFVMCGGTLTQILSQDHQRFMRRQCQGLT